MMARCSSSPTTSRCAPPPMGLACMRSPRRPTPLSPQVCSAADGLGNCSAWSDALNATGGTTFFGSNASSPPVFASNGQRAAQGGAHVIVNGLFAAPVTTDFVRIYPFGACLWICGLRAGVLLHDLPPPPPPSPLPPWIGPNLPPSPPMWPPFDETLNPLEKHRYV